jgi:integrase
MSPTCDQKSGALVEGDLTMYKSQAPFKLYRRKSGKSKLPIYYARFLQPDGTYTSGRSTGVTNRKYAEIKAYEYLQTGKVVSVKNMKLKDFSQDYFSWDNEWAVSKRSSGLRVSRVQCDRNESILRSHVNKRLGEVYLADFDTALVRKFRNDMFREGFSGSTINKALGCLKSILESAEEQHLIRNMPRFQRASLQTKTKGILTLDEVNTLFAVPWDDELAYVANLVAASTGFRLSEARGSRKTLNLLSRSIQMSYARDRYGRVIENRYGDIVLGAHRGKGNNTTARAKGSRKQDYRKNQYQEQKKQMRIDLIKLFW